MTSPSYQRAGPKVSQFRADAQLMSAFDESRDSAEGGGGGGGGGGEEEIGAYLNKIQRGGLVQPHGCLLYVHKTNLSILSYSENAGDWLGAVSLGMDVRAIFTPPSATAVAKAMACLELSQLNPIWVQSASNRNCYFHAILHRLDLGVVFDLEPAVENGGDLRPAITATIQAQKIAFRSAWKLQSSAACGLDALFLEAVESVKELTGYDRVVVFKFHKDEHGEVVAEKRRSDLEPYLGLHFPATDIPQVARFLFEQDRVRMICDCGAAPARIVQDDEKLQGSLRLVKSTLRAPHACHVKYLKNMGVVATMTMAIVVKENISTTKLWGLIICHHTSPRYVQYPVRCACEFVIQAFSAHLGCELRRKEEEEEKRIVKLQSLLFARLVAGNPLASILTGSPSVVDLVKCDGAALFCNRELCFRGMCPTELQIWELLKWVVENHGDRTGVVTDCLVEAGFAGETGELVCGLAYVRLNPSSHLLWFRSKLDSSIRRSGCNCSLLRRLRFVPDVPRRRSAPWSEVEIDAIRSLQLTACSVLGSSKTAEAVVVIAKLEGKNSRPVPAGVGRSLMPAIFTADGSLRCSEWNPAMERVTGWGREEAIGKQIAGEVFGRCCRWKGGGDESSKLKMLLREAADGGRDAAAVCFSFYRRDGRSVDALFAVTPRRDASGCIGFVQVVTTDIREVVRIRRPSENSI